MMFQVGDVVVLKSGGPAMTITVLPNENSRSLFCRWFDEKGELQGSSFAPAAVKKIEDRVDEEI